MRQIVKNPINYNDLSRFEDGAVMTLGIEQFPVRSENINTNGFPMNDVTLLLEVARKVGVNTSRFDAIAGRLNVLRSSESNKGKLLSELWKSWKPASLQTPQELKDFEEWYLAKYPEDATTTTLDKPKDITQPVKEEKSTE